ncbi:MAG: type II toxin-antitoxin system HicA family toxin [Desulfarculales bacterium]|jgi:predicted RNA binding protein YcfA (HicA-like mRNA interferase family)|nr:type II toxin-antitoxin system HicA family toxin [Desulfarculales bacterium]
MKDREVIEKLKTAGWTITSGTDHWKAYSPDGQTMTTIPRHKGKEISPRTLANIIRVTKVKMK